MGNFIFDLKWSYPPVGPLKKKKKWPASRPIEKEKEKKKKKIYVTAAQAKSASLSCLALPISYYSVSLTTTCTVLKLSMTRLTLGPGLYISLHNRASSLITSPLCTHFELQRTVAALHYIINVAAPAWFGLVCTMCPRGQEAVTVEWRHGEKWRDCVQQHRKVSRMQAYINTLPRRHCLGC